MQGDARLPPGYHSETVPLQERATAPLLEGARFLVSGDAWRTEIRGTWGDAMTEAEPYKGIDLTSLRSAP